jgi:hypothetical protein
MSVSATRSSEAMLYRPPANPVLVEVPSFEFLMVDGTGDPNGSADFEQAVAALYAMSYPIVITLKRAGRSGLHVRPLEGLWWADDLGVFQTFGGDRRRWRWTMMIRQPEDVPASFVDAAVAAATKKLGREIAGRARLERFEEGLCAQLADSNQGTRTHYGGAGAAQTTTRASGPGQRP